MPSQGLMIGGGIGQGLIQGLQAFNDTRKTNIQQEREDRSQKMQNAGLLLKALEGGYNLDPESGTLDQTPYAKQKQDTELSMLRNQGLISQAETKAKLDALKYINGGGTAAPSFSPHQHSAQGGLMSPQSVAPQATPITPMRNPDQVAAPMQSLPQGEQTFGSPPQAGGGLLGLIPGMNEAVLPQGRGETGPTESNSATEEKIRSGEQMERGATDQGLGVDARKLKALKMAGILSGTASEKASDEHGKYMKLQNEVNEANRVFDIASRNATFRGRISRNLKPNAMGEGSSSSWVGDIVKPALGMLSQGAAIGDDQTKAYQAVTEPFVDKLAKDVTGRSTPISIEKLSRTMPEQGDSANVLAIKRQKLLELLKSSYSFPHLVENGLVSPNDPLLNAGGLIGR